MSRRYVQARFIEGKVYGRGLFARRSHEAWLIEEKTLEVFIRRLKEEGFA
jgi:hypothetical protein